MNTTRKLLQFLEFCSVPYNSIVRDMAIDVLESLLEDLKNGNTFPDLDSTLNHLEKIQGKAFYE
jgi:hypothetical protein